MKRTCYLHIGMHKTGSSVIQKSLIGYDDGQTSYCDFGQSNHTAPLSLIFSRRPEKLNLFKKKGQKVNKINSLKKAAYEKLLNEINLKDTDTISSAEDLSTNLNLNEISDLLSFLKQHYSKIQIIAYLRPALSFATSAFQQRVKGGRSSVFAMPPANYRKRFEPWIVAAGNENIHFIKYDRAELLNNDVVDDFCNRTNVDISKVNKVQANEALSAEALAILFCHNKFSGRLVGSPKHAVAQRKLIAAVTSIGSNRFSFSETITKDFLKQHDADIEWMETIANVTLRDPVKKAQIVFGSEEDIITLGGKQAKHIEKLFLHVLHITKQPHIQNAALTDALTNLYFDQ